MVNEGVFVFEWVMEELEEGDEVIGGLNEGVGCFLFNFILGELSLLLLNYCLVFDIIFYKNKEKGDVMSKGGKNISD